MPANVVYGFAESLSSDEQAAVENVVNNEENLLEENLDVDLNTVSETILETTNETFNSVLAEDIVVTEKVTNTTDLLENEVVEVKNEINNEVSNDIFVNIENKVKNEVIVNEVTINENIVNDITNVSNIVNENVEKQPIADTTINNVVENSVNNINNLVDDEIIEDEINVKELISVEGTVLWDDNGNLDGKRPEKVLINLLRNNVVYKFTEITPDENGEWKFIFDSLEKYGEDGSEIVYEISETPILNYETRIDENGNVINKLIQVVQKTYTKTWKDNENAYGTRPTSTVINLYKNNEIVPVQTIEIKPDENNVWTYTFLDLEKYNENGIENVYKIIENELSGYETIVVEDGNSISTLKDELDLNLSIKWNDENNLLRPNCLTIHLLNGDNVVETMALLPDENDVWNYTYNALDMYDENGVKNNYSIKIDEIENYETQITKLNETEIKVINTVIEKVQVDLTVEELLDVGPYVAMIVKLAEESGEELTAEEKAIYDTYKELIFVRGADLAAIALVNGTDSFTAEEKLIYERYQEIILNGGNLAAKIDTLDIEVSGDKFNSKEILSVVRRDGNYYRYVVVNGGAVNNSLKYVASKDGAKPKNGDRVAYCMNYDRSFSSDNIYNGNAWTEKVNDTVYGKVFKKLYSELAYVVSIGCKTYGGTSDSGYSTADFIKKYSSSANAIWQEDYYATQTAIYMIIYDYTHSSSLNSILNTIDFTAEERATLDKTELLKQISAIFSGHSSNITYNSGESNSSYGDAHAKAVVDAAKKIYTAAKEYRNDVNSSVSDGYDASITMTPSNQMLKYEDGYYKATVTVNTVGDLVGNVTFSGVSGMTWTNNGNTYTISIPATSVTNVNKVTITATARFNKVKTVTYICADSSKQNVAFMQEQGKNSTAQTISVDVTKPATVVISGKKTWLDDNNSLKTRPGSITVNLLADNVKVDSKIVSDATNWEYKFEGHAKYNSNGRIINYKIEEVNVKGYTTLVANKYDLVNRLTGTVSVNGTKTWIDNENEYLTRPDEITVKLYSNVKGVNEKFVKEQVVSSNADDTWTYEFKDLPKYDENGALYTYLVKETEVENYVSTSDGTNLVNTLTGNVDVVGTKVWNDENNLYETRPESITVRLYKNDNLTALETKTIYPDVNGNWTYEFKNLDKYDENGTLIVYKVVEDSVENYKTTYDVDNSYNLINTLTGKVTVSGEKIWKDNNNAYETRPEKIVVNLFRSDKLEVVDTYTIYPDRLNNWKYEFKDLEKYDELGKLIEYKVVEDNVDKYKVSYDENNEFNLINTLTDETELDVTKKWLDNGNAYETRPESIIVKLLANGKEIESFEIKENDLGAWEHKFERLAKYDENGVLISYTIDEEVVDLYEKNINENTLVNKLVGKTDVKVIKNWKDNGNAYRTRPEKITINLFKNNDQNPIQTVDMYPDGLGNWSYIFENLDKYDENGVLITYSVTENSVENYVLSAEKVNDYEFVFTNALTGMTEYSGLKFWKDNNNLYGTRPNSIIVNLLANGKVTDTKEVVKDENGDWKYIFENLIKYDEQGRLIEYKVEEEEIPNYVSKLENSNLINRLHDTIDVSGTKIWVDKDNTYKTRPEYIIVELFANGVKVAEKEIKEDENGEWKFCFEDVDKYDEDGVLYEYTLNEQPVMGYEIHVNSLTNTIYNILNYKEEKNKQEVLDNTPKTGKKNWLKLFITSAISSLLALFGIGKRKLLGEGK